MHNSSIVLSDNIFSTDWSIIAYRKKYTPISGIAQFSDKFLQLNFFKKNLFHNPYLYGSQNVINKIIWSIVLHIVRKKFIKASGRRTFSDCPCFIVETKWQMKPKKHEHTSWSLLIYDRIQLSKSEMFYNHKIFFCPDMSTTQIILSQWKKSLQTLESDMCLLQSPQILTHEKKGICFLLNLWKYFKIDPPCSCFSFKCHISLQHTSSIKVKNLSLTSSKTLSQKTKKREI